MFSCPECRPREDEGDKNNVELLRLFVDGPDWAETLVTVLMSGIGPGLETERKRALYGLGLEIHMAIGKEMMKVTGDIELIEREEKR